MYDMYDLIDQFNITYELNMLKNAHSDKKMVLKLEATLSPVRSHG